MPAAVEPEVVARPPGPGRFLRTLQSLRTRLLALVLLALAPAAALIVWMNVDARRTRDDEVRASAQRLVHVCAAAYAGALDEAREFLRTLSDVPILTAGSPRECSAFLADVLPRHPGFANVGVAGANGLLRCSALPFSRTVDLSGRAYFARALNARRFEIGEFQGGQVTGRSTLNVALPIADGDRPPRAVLYAALDLAWLGRLARDAEVPEGGTLTVADRGGTIVARNPNPEIVGRTVANVPLVRRVMAEREGTGETSGVDGVRRMYAFTTLLNHGEPYAYVAVGFPRDIAYAQADRMLWRSLLLFGLALAGALTLAWAGAEALVLRRAKALITASRRLQAGEYSARSGVGGEDELGRLAATFDDLAAALERREQDRQVWAAEISKLHASLEQRVRDRTAELEAANQQLESFSYSVSHDLRAPLRHLAGFAALLERTAGDRLDEQGRRYLKTINDSAAHMGRLIDDLLTLSRIGRSEMRRDAVDLNQIVADARRQVEADVNGRLVIWTVDALPTVAGDPALLQLAFVNLLSNALKYTRTRPEARIDVRADREPSGDAVIAVRDNGVGFDMQYADKLFGVFQRLHRREDFEGTGIGLATVHRIVQRHGGRTWAEGAVDQGATFFVALPQERNAT